MSYQPINDLVKDGNGDPIKDSHNILNSWKNYFSHLLKVHKDSDVRQIEIHTVEPLVPGPNTFEVPICLIATSLLKSTLNARALPQSTQGFLKAVSSAHYYTYFIQLTFQPRLTPSLLPLSTILQSLPLTVILPLRLKLLLQSWRNISRQVVIKFRQNWFINVWDP
jgi:hypothetical protein